MRASRIPLDLRITAIYVLFGVFWIFTGGRLLESWVHDLPTYSRFELFKGILFVLLSAALIYAMAHRGLLALEKIQRELGETQNAIVQSEARFRTSLNSVMEGCQIIDFDWRLIYVNEAAAHQLGGHPEQLLMRTMTDTYPGIETTELFRVMGHCMVERVPGRVETELSLRDGATRSFEFSIQPIPEGLFVLSMDRTERKQTEQALRAAEERYHAIFDGAVEGIFQSTPDGQFLTVNPALARMWGYASSQELVESVHDIASQIYADPGARTQYISALQGQGEVYGFEYQVRRKDGILIWVSENARAVRNSEGEIAYFEGYIEDITSSKQARIEQERLLQTLEASLNEIYIFDVGTLKFQYVNAAARHNLSYSLEQLRSMTPFNLQPLLEEATFRKYLDCLLYAQQKTIVFETLHQRADISLYPVEVHLQLVERDNERVFLAVIDDITERKQAEKSLHESEQRYRTLAEAAQEMIFIIDRAGKVDYVNEYGARQFGNTPRNIVGKHLRELFPPAVANKRLQILQRAAESGEAAYSENLIQLGEHEMWLGTNLVPLKNAQGEFHAILGVARDITSQKRAAQELRKSEERYRGLFEDSPISLWEEDFSAVKSRLDALREAGITDFRKYFETHQQELTELIGSVKVLDVNKATLQLLEVTDKAELLTSLKPVFEEDAHAGFINELVNIAAGQLHFLWEGVNYTREGKRLDVSMKWSVAPGHENDLSRVLVSIIDITKPKQAESAIKESEARYRGLFEYSPIALREEDFSAIKKRLDALRREGVIDFHTYLSQHPEVVTDCAALAKVVDVNNATLQQYGATNKEQLLTNLSDILHGDAIEHFTCQLAHMADGQTSFNWEGLDRKVDGSLINVQVSWSVAPGHEEDLSKVFVSIMDITERKQAEAALQASEEKYRKLFSEMLSGCALQQVICEDGKPVDYITLDANNSFEQLIGVSKESVIGRRASESMSPDELKQWVSIFGPVALEGKSARYELYSSINQKYFEGNAFCTEKGVCAVTFSDITERKQADERIQQHLKRITALRDIDRIIASSLDLHLTLNRLLNHVTEQLQVDAATILLFSPHTFTLEYFATRGLQETHAHDFQILLGDGFAGQVAIERKMMHFDINQSKTFSNGHNPLFKPPFVEYYGLPLVSKGQLRGVLEVYHRSSLSPNVDWFDYLDTLAGQAAVAIDNIQLFDGLQRSNIELAHAYDATIEGWSRALDMRDKETEGHTQRVTELTIALAREFGLSGEELANIRWGSLLHDIGKMGIPDAILLKPGSLTEEEWARMRQHPELAYELLSRIQYLRSALDIPHYHHEKWDGSGYPQGLRGEQIPLAARIFAVVDIWDALRSDRPYRPAWSSKKILQHIRDLSGTHLDPKVVQVFLDRKIYEIKVVER